MRKIAYFFYKLLRLLDFLFKIIKKDGILIWFNDFINKEFYITKNINCDKMIFFAPNQIIKWRVDTLFTKEPETIEWINNFKTKKNKITFWDIGANIGLYSLYASKIHDDIEIISFEPSTSNLRVLSRNISINKMDKKISICQIPLGNYDKANLTMHESDFTEGWSMNTFGKPINFEGNLFDSKQKYNIFGTSIDFLLSNKFYNTPDYLKIDVDGIEDEILLGGEKLLSDQKLKSISVELNENFKSQFEKVNTLMKKHSFQFKQKKHAKIFDKNNKFSSVFNYVFER